jgi:hypothetical protein
MPEDLAPAHPFEFDPGPTNEQIKNLLHPLVRSDDPYEMKEAIALLERIGGKHLSRPSQNELRLGSVTYEPSTGRIGFDLYIEPIPARWGSSWVELIWLALVHQGDSKPMSKALMFLCAIDGCRVEREDDELIIFGCQREAGEHTSFDRINYHPDTGTIWLNGQREPWSYRGLDGVKALICMLMNANGEAAE